MTFSETGMIRLFSECWFSQRSPDQTRRKNVFPVEQIDRSELLELRLATYLGAIGLWVYLWLWALKPDIDQLFGRPMGWWLVAIIALSLCHGVAVQCVFDRSAAAVTAIWALAIAMFALGGIILGTTSLAVAVPHFAHFLAHLIFGQFVGSLMVLAWQGYKTSASNASTGG